MHYDDSWQKIVILFEQQVIPRAFESSKDDILSCATLMYYDDEKPCTIQVDASNVGVGAMLIQEAKVIEYHS